MECAEGSRKKAPLCETGWCLWLLTPGFEHPCWFCWTTGTSPWVLSLFGICPPGWPPEKCQQRWQTSVFPPTRDQERKLVIGAKCCLHGSGQQSLASFRLRFRFRPVHNKVGICSFSRNVWYCAETYQSLTSPYWHAACVQLTCQVRFFIVTRYKELNDRAVGQSCCYTDETITCRENLIACWAWCESL